MGKRKLSAASVDNSLLLNHKRPRKQKYLDGADDNSISRKSNSDAHSNHSSIQPTLKLKIKIGGQLVGSSRFSVSRDEQDSLSTSAGEVCVEDDIIADVSADSDSVVWDPSSRLVADSSSPPEDEEQKWLNALESGDLDDNGELKREKDLSILTARQRALLHGEQVEELLELPSLTKQTSSMTEEQLKRRQIRAKRRKEKAQEKTEKDKKETLDRLLKKQDPKMKNQQKPGRRDAQLGLPVFTYINSQSFISVSVPTGYDFPLSAVKATEPPVRQLCGVSGCTNAKKYSCSRTGVPLCSLDCYRKNLAVLEQSSATTATKDSESAIV